MDPEATAADLIVHQLQANDATERLCDAIRRGFPVPSIKRVTDLVQGRGHECSEHEVALALRAAVGPRRRQRPLASASTQLWLFRVA